MNNIAERYKQELDVIQEHPGIRQIQLARLMKLDHSTVFYRLRELERAGIVSLMREQGVVKAFLK